MKKNIILIFFLAVVCAGCSGKIMHKSTRLFMGTYFEIEIPKSRNSSEIIEEAYSRIKEIDDSMSIFRNSSEISRINSLASEKPVKISEDMFKILNRSLEIYKLSGGAFDITVGALLDIWGFDKDRNFNVPDKNKLKEAMGLIGSDKIELDAKSRTVFLKKKGVKLDLGGIAKGYAIDEAVKIFKKYGIKSALIKGGGEMHLIGLRSYNKPWIVGIRNPRDKNCIVAKLGLKDISIATSGDYENYFLKDGTRFSHLINPKTGIALGEDIMGVTVLSNNSTDCDALATAAYILGKEEGIKFIEEKSGAECLIVFEENGAIKILKSKNFEKFCEFYEEIK